MATANNSHQPPMSRGRRLRRIALLALILVVLAIAWFWQPISARAAAGTAYGARVACSCRYLGERTLEQCEADFLPGMGMVALSEDVEARSVTASVPLIASDTAMWRKGEGCRLEPWED